MFLSTNINTERSEMLAPSTLISAAASSFHAAYSVMFLVTLSVANIQSEEPFALVAQPPNVAPVLEGEAGAVSSAFSDTVCVTVDEPSANVPPLALKVTVYCVTGGVTPPLPSEGVLPSLQYVHAPPGIEIVITPSESVPS